MLGQREGRAVEMGFYSISIQKIDFVNRAVFNLIVITTIISITVGAAMKGLVLPRDCCVLELLMFLDELPPESRAPNPLCSNVNL